MEPTAGEWRVFQEIQHAVDVVFQVLPVVGQIRVRPAVRRRQKNLHSIPMRYEAQSRSDGTVGAVRFHTTGGRLRKQRLFELVDEPLAEASHEIGRAHV